LTGVPEIVLLDDDKKELDKVVSFLKGYFYRIAGCTGPELSPRFYFRFRRA
jgi:hypothetical protein